MEGSRHHILELLRVYLMGATVGTRNHITRDKYNIITSVFIFCVISNRHMINLHGKGV